VLIIGNPIIVAIISCNSTEIVSSTKYTKQIPKNTRENKLEKNCFAFDKFLRIIRKKKLNN